MGARNPYTHTQFKDGDGVVMCERGSHDFVPMDPEADAGDEDFDGEMICRYCGAADPDDER